MASSGERDNDGLKVKRSYKQSAAPPPTGGVSVDQFSEERT